MKHITILKDNIFEAAYTTNHPEYETSSETNNATTRQKR